MRRLRVLIAHKGRHEGDIIFVPALYARSLTQRGLCVYHYEEPFDGVPEDVADVDEGTDDRAFEDDEGEYT